MNRRLVRVGVIGATALLLLTMSAAMACADPGGAPRIRVSRGTSSNWSGYAAQTSLTSPQSGAVSDVVGTWQVPFVTGSTNAWSSAWVGIDGYSDATVEQIGTEQDTSKFGATRYYAWYEMYPAASVLISGLAINPGNVITGRVRYAGSNQYVLSLNNTSTGHSYQTTQTVSAQRSSAEWIMEAPSSGRILPLANFGTVSFTGCNATVNDVSGPISQWAHDPLTMVTGGKKSTAKAVPSALSSDGTAFTVTWQHK
jgi:hypothetical protein